MQPNLSFEDLRFFGTVATSPTLAAAARTLDVTPSAVTQRLQQLEARLRVRLVDRSTRRFVLTEEGELLAERGSALIATLGEVAEALAARRGSVTGRLRVVAPFGFGRAFVAPLAAKFRRDHADATIALTLSENPGRLPADSWDLLVHVGKLRDSNLISQRLAPNDRIVCASPDYLCERGPIETPDMLRLHDCVVLRENDEDDTLWRFTGPDGRSATLRIDPVMASNDGEVVRDWALAGLGIVIRSEWDVADDLRAGRLVRVMPDWTPPAADVTALLSERSQRAARTNCFLEILKDALSPPPWRWPAHGRQI